MRNVLRTMALVLTLLAMALRSFAGQSLVEGSDERAKPIKQAVASLVKQIEGGALDKAKAEYAGTGADLDLLKAYVRGVAEAKAMRAALTARFGGHFFDHLDALDAGVARMAVADYNTVIFLDDPNRASSSADSPLGVGLEFRRVDGKWKVLSLASAPDTAEEHLKRLKDYTAAVEKVTETAKSGGYASADDAKQAVFAVERLLRPSPAKAAAPTTAHSR